MFGFGNRATSSHGKKTSRDLHSAAPPTRSFIAPSCEFDTAIDGPPSPEKIRAYTEQMRRSAMFAGRSRSNTLSSAASSFRSRDSLLASTDNNSLSRTSSEHSNELLPSKNRPESLSFGKSLLRGARKLRRDHNSLSEISSIAGVTDEGDGVSFAQEYYASSRKSSRSSSRPPSSSATKGMC